MTIPFYALDAPRVLISLPVSSSLGARIPVHLDDTSVYFKLDSTIPNDTNWNLDHHFIQFCSENVQNTYH